MRADHDPRVVHLGSPLKFAATPDRFSIVVPRGIDALPKLRCPRRRVMGLTTAHFVSTVVDLCALANSKYSPAAFS